MSRRKVNDLEQPYQPAVTRKGDHRFVDQPTPLDLRRNPAAGEARRPAVSPPPARPAPGTPLDARPARVQQQHPRTRTDRLKRRTSPWTRPASRVPAPRTGLPAWPTPGSPDGAAGSGRDDDRGPLRLLPVQRLRLRLPGSPSLPGPGQGQGAGQQRGHHECPHLKLGWRATDPSGTTQERRGRRSQTDPHRLEPGQPLCCW